MKSYFLLFNFIFLLSGPTLVFAQNGSSSISGRIIDTSSEPVPGLTISVKNQPMGDVSDHDGKYRIKGVYSGDVTLIISGVGFAKVEKKVAVPPSGHVELNLQVEEEALFIDELVIQGVTTSSEKSLEGYSVNVIDTRKQKNLNADLNQLLKASPGIHIRESGGVGSNFTLSLNGLSGNQIRYFVDGIPMENFGSALTLNNFPVNLIDNIEVYKGVVPITLGADALGGAINIITNYRLKDFLDLSYSVGSFNTHRASLNGQHVNEEKRYFIRASSFFNHSDNNYWIEEAPVYDLELGNFEGNIRTRRFHSAYTSGMMKLEAGLYDRKIADKFTIAITGAANENNYQHPDNTLFRAFGDFHTNNESALISGTYTKTIKNLQIDAFTILGKSRESVVDTSSYKYNWAGERIRRPADDPKGELFERRSLLRLSDDFIKSQLNTQYTLNENHEIALSFSHAKLHRTGDDEVNEFNQSFETPNYVGKSILGASYSFISNDKKLDITAFGKEYWYSGEIITYDTERNEQINAPAFSNMGYGLALNYLPVRGLQFKTSFEKAYRIPEPHEILGDGIYIRPNPVLEPEKSYNGNLGGRYTLEKNKFKISSEVNFFYRFSQNFIRFNPLGPFGEFENIDNVLSQGIEGGANLEINNKVNLVFNFTYQNITDQTEYDEGLPNTNYKSRVPNIPYLFGNIRLGYNLLSEDKNSNLILYWNSRYVHDFFLTWENLGRRDSKYIIPAQLIHDLQAEYSFREGKYNISIGATNITNELAFDNFRIQKPGRAGYIKLRYYIDR